MKIKLNAKQCCKSKEEHGCCHHYHNHDEQHGCCGHREDHHQCCGHDHQDDHQCCGHHHKDGQHQCCHNHGDGGCNHGKEKNKGHGKNHLNCKARIKVAGREDALFEKVVAEVRQHLPKGSKIGYIIDDALIAKYHLNVLPAILIDEQIVWDNNQAFETIEDVLKNN